MTARNQGDMNPIGRTHRVSAACAVLLAVACLLEHGCGPVLPPNVGPPATNGSDQNNGNGGGGALDMRITADDHSVGSAEARVTVVEYIDFECAGCGFFATEVFPAIKAEYVDGGEVRWVFRQFPLRSIHELAEFAAEASECAADQGRFFDYQELLFENRPQYEDDALKEYASSLGLDRAAFDACLDDGAKEAAVQEDVDSGIGFGATGTPTFFVNGEKHSGVFTIEPFSEILDLALAAAADDSPFGDGGFE